MSLARVAVTEPRRVGRRVVAEIDGTAIWFESDDVELRAAPEAWASAALVAAAGWSRGLALEAPIPRDWLANAPQILEVVRTWWGWDAPAPVALGGERPVRAAGPQSTGLCFSGGADSFHALLHGPRPVDVLVTALGYDVPLADEARCRSMDHSVRRVADALQKQAVVVRTNLLDHPLHIGTDWGRTHGGALAALGHLLGDQIDTLVIAASYPRAQPAPWGSRWDLDHLWSADVAIEHVGEDHWRAEKLEAIADEPVVQEELRVCWEHRTDDRNCGRCEKCLRTAVGLLAADRLGSFASLPQAPVLAGRLDALDAPGAAAVSFRALIDDGTAARLPDDIRRSVEAIAASAPLSGGRS